MKYKCGYRYITGEEVVVPVPEAWADIDAAVGSFVKLKDKTLYLSEEYPWDGASFPLFKIFGTPATWMLPSGAHDGMYFLMNQSKIPLTFRIVADGIFYRLLMERLPYSVYLSWMPKPIRYGISWCIAKTAYYVVRVCGNYCARHGAKMHEAP